MSLSTTGLFRITKNGTDLSRLYEDPTQVACLYGNHVYYQHYDHKKGLELYSAKIDGSKNKLLKREAISPYSVSGNTIYYSGWAKDIIFIQWNVSGANDKVIYNGNCTSVIKQATTYIFLT